MNKTEFDQHVESVITNCKHLLGYKGADYSYTDTDRLSNFKENAQDLNLSKYQIWYVYFNKGMSAIRRFINKGCVESENIHNRIADAINYLILLDAMIAEDEVQNPAELITEPDTLYKIQDYVVFRCTDWPVFEITEVYRTTEGNFYDLENTLTDDVIKRIKEREIEKR